MARNAASHTVFFVHCRGSSNAIYPQIVCVSRRGSSNALNGCINDAHCMMFLLKSRFQFQDSDFRVLTDDQASPSQWPTRANMFEGFRWLAADARPGDSLVFHYSGQHLTCIKQRITPLPVSGSVFNLHTCMRPFRSASYLYQAAYYTLTLV